MHDVEKNLDPIHRNNVIVPTCVEDLENKPARGFVRVEAQDLLEKFGQDCACC